MAAWKGSSFSLWLVTLSCLIGVPAGQLVFDADRSRICPVVNDLFASGNVSTAKECSREKPLCLDFECEFDLEDGVSTPVPLAIEAHIVPCAYTLFEGGADQAISEVHIFVYGEGESLVLDVILEENATFVTEHTTSTETVTIKKNITVMQQAEGIVFGMLLVILPLNGTPVYVSVYDPILIRIPCVPPPTSSPPPPPPTSPPPSASPPPPTTPPPPTLPPVTENLALVAGVPVLSVLIVIILAMAMVLVALCVVWRIRMKRSNKSNLTYLSREDRSTDTSKRYTDIKVSGNPMFHHQLPVPLDEKEEEEEETYDEINIMRPAYGVTSIEWNYVQYNIGRSRKDEAWVYPRSKLAYLKDISQGQYAKFMLMEAQNIASVEGVMPVIVKALCSSEKLPQQSFDQELQLRKTYHHQNIVSLLGVCTDTVGLTMMVLELMDYGDLLHFVKLHGPTKFRQAVVDYSDFYNFASDISGALEYLAENGFVHGGVAAENCLVGRNLMVKLTGFSSVAAAGQESAIGEEDPYYFTMVADEGPSNASVLSAGRDALPSKKPQESEGLLRWKAPETLVYGKCTTKSDVWSFGVLLWELATYGSVPHAKLSTNDVLQNALQGTLKLSLPTHCPEDYSKVVASCQRLEPVDRPSFQELFSLLSMKADKMIKFEKNCLYEL